MKFTIFFVALFFTLHVSYSDELNRILESTGYIKFKYDTSKIVAMLIDLNCNKIIDKNEELVIVGEEYKEEFISYLNKYYSNTGLEFKKIFIIRNMEDQKLIEREENLCLLDICKKYGAELSLIGVHPLSKRNVYFVPDGSGTFVKDPQTVLLYKSGRFKELDVRFGKSYPYRLKNGQILDVWHAMFHENGKISFVSTNLGNKIEYDGISIDTQIINWDDNGEICGFIIKSEQKIELSLPDGSIATDVVGFSYWTLNIEPGVLKRNNTVTEIQFSPNNNNSITLPNGDPAFNDEVRQKPLQVF